MKIIEDVTLTLFEAKLFMLKIPTYLQLTDKARPNYASE